MKQKLFIFILLISTAVVLIGLNAASYQQKEKTPDTELAPNRSSFNAGATGTQAFFTLLNETGRGPTRWQEPPAALITARKNTPAVFVVIGELRRPYTEQETTDLFRWVSSGGRLVLIDRDVPESLAMTTANWRVSVKGKEVPDLLTVDSSDPLQMTKGVAGVRPAQPSVFSQGVNAIQPSRFAGAVSFERFIDPDVPKVDDGDAPPPPKAVPPPSNVPTKPVRVERNTGQVYQMPSPTPFEITTVGGTSVESPSQMAPVVHFADGANNLLVEMPYGEGKIVFLTDPFIVSNAGISMVDNAQLAINLVAAGQGAIAFDEYHQGYGVDNNRFLQFFAGTPVVAIFLQLAVIVALVFVSQSRRFARAVPEREEDRLSKLEYIAAMAELQSRTKAFDLAVENIYTDFRRRVARSLALDHHSMTSVELAGVVAERTGRDRREIAEIFSKCEHIVHGQPTNKREVLKLVEELRGLEASLNLSRQPKGARI
jgi:Domain of unknown function (DUF4350)